MSKTTVSRADRPAVRKRAGSGKGADAPLGDGVKKVASKGRVRLVDAAPPEEEAPSGSLVQQAIRAVGNYMRDQGLRPGDTLPGEKYFGDELGVSRAVMREAFGALGALQIIDIARGRKPKVSHVDGSLFATSIVHGFNTSQISILDVWEVRRTVEIRTTELAAALRTDAEMAEIERIFDSIASNMGDLEKLAQANAEFHLAIARASHNVLFAQILSSFAPITRIATREAWRSYGTKALKQTQLRRHKAIVRAIARKDPEAAADAMREVFDDAIRENWSRLAAHRFSFDPFFESGQLLKP